MMSTENDESAAGRVQAMLTDRANEIMEQTAAADLMKRVDEHHGDPKALRREVLGALEKTELPESDQVYLLSAIDEFEVPGSALTREEAADPEWSVEDFDNTLPGPNREEALYAAPPMAPPPPPTPGPFLFIDQAELDRLEELTVRYANFESFEDAVRTHAEMTKIVERHGFKNFEHYSEHVQSSLIVVNPGPTAPEPVSPPVQPWPAAQVSPMEMTQTGPSMSM